VEQYVLPTTGQPLIFVQMAIFAANYSRFPKVNSSEMLVQDFLDAECRSYCPTNIDKTLKNNTYYHLPQTQTCFLATVTHARLLTGPPTMNTHQTALHKCVRL